MSGDLPEGFTSKYVDCGEVTIHVVTNARESEDRPAILFLHGFPEYWAAWRPAFERLAEDFHIVAPDLRGFNLSDAPQDKESYATKLLVGDVLCVAEKCVGSKKFLLAGHDWGASIAYALAMRFPQKLIGLVVVNGVHPVLFQRALIDDPGQREASQYFHTLTANGAAVLMAEHDFARTFSMFEKFSHTPWLSETDRAGYHKAWAQPGRLNAMLNWYRGSPIIVPKDESESIDAPLYDGKPEEYAVRVPHLLIWGSRDQALRSSSWRGLKEFAPELSIIEIPEGDHWVIHTHGERIADDIRKFHTGIAARK